MHQGGSLPSLPHYHHRPRGSAIILRQRRMMVWITCKSHQRQGSPIHQSIWESTCHQARDYPEFINSLPSPNRRTVRAQKPMGRAISPTCYVGSTRGLGSMANDSVCGTQQPEKPNNQPIPKPDFDGLRHSPEHTE